MPGASRVPPYRSRALLDPRGVLADFGVTVAEGMRISVHDSTSEVRYLVVPTRPAGTEGLDEAALAALVTRDAMIGTGLAVAVAEVGGTARTGRPTSAA